MFKGQKNVVNTKGFYYLCVKIGKQNNLNK